MSRTKHMIDVVKVLPRRWGMAFDGLWQPHPERVMGFAMALFFIFFTWSSILFHKEVPLGHWQHHLRADAAGYYIYLPGTFHHGMKAAGVSEALLEKAGGFQVDRQQDRIRTKYTYGSALLMLPFFLVAEAIEGPGDTDGWTLTHHHLIEVSGIFYLSASLFFLSLALIRWHHGRFSIVLIVLVLAAFGTNVFYYGFRMPAYSHIYSFFLTCLGFYSIFSRPGPLLTPFWRGVFVICTSLLVIIRPVDVIASMGLLLILYLYRPAEVVSGRYWLWQAASFLVLFAPQAIYWQFVHGAWVHYSYTGEGFTNWSSPKFREVLFAPGNGLLLNAPAFTLLPFGLLVLMKRNASLAVVITVVIALIIYACASWHVWTFGCSYGQRSMVQYVPFLAFVIYALLRMLSERVPWMYHGMVPLLVIVSYINYRGMLNFDTCYGWGELNWYHYYKNVLEAFLGSSFLQKP